MQNEIVQMKIIAHIHTDFPQKFGIPRQSGLSELLKARIIFLPPYRSVEAFRGLEEYSHIWIIWQFSDLNSDAVYGPTVRPPRLGGNKRMGVFATRSPYRPNPMGLSAVKLERIEYTKAHGPVLHVSGADLLDGTPIFDIKPYLAYTDSRPYAVSGFAAEVEDYKLNVECEPLAEQKIMPEYKEALYEVLSQDPRPSYHNNPDRIYGLSFANMEIKFKVDGDKLYIIDVKNKYNTC